MSHLDAPQEIVYSCISLQARVEGMLAQDVGPIGRTNLRMVSPGSCSSQCMELTPSDAEIHGYYMETTERGRHPEPRAAGNCNMLFLDEGVGLVYM